MENNENDELLPYYSECCLIIDGILKSGVNFIAIDFDLTLIEIHTANRPIHTLSVDKIKKFVRPFFKTFLKLLLIRNFYVAIVSFSKHVDLIRDIIHDMLAPELSKSVIIKGSDSIVYDGDGCKLGKQIHMTTAVMNIIRREKFCGNDISITRASSLLIDDDVKNIATALREGVRAVHFNPQNLHHFIEDMTSLFP